MQKVDKLKEKNSARNYKKAITGPLMPYFRDTSVQELKPKQGFADVSAKLF
ncbi:hypothetical protein [Spartinivicinus ruber]|uniref:hypothetical protein n=1 Tax=Spartinivicinus ruber TaxID=2683272 RepID=UPI0013D07E0B|nr:hypothetical protein [Spartinivicinus ruber]